VHGGLEPLNADLEARCRADLRRRLRGKPATKAELLDEERPALIAPPREPFLAARVELRCVDSLSLVRFDTNDYSVPVAFAHHRVTAVGTVDAVRIVAGEQPGAELAEHGGVEARVGQIEAEQVLPVDAGADRLGRLAVGEVRAALEHGDQGQPPGREGGLPTFGVEVGKVVVAKDRPELIAEPEVGIALGEGGAGALCGVLGDGRDGAGLQGQGDTSGRLEARLAASCKA
jgi:hypothetical protein